MFNEIDGSKNSFSLLQYFLQGNLTGRRRDLDPLEVSLLPLSELDGTDSWLGDGFTIVPKEWPNSGPDGSIF